jgi:hypothetical protein
VLAAAAAGAAAHEPSATQRCKQQSKQHASSTQSCSQHCPPTEHEEKYTGAPHCWQQCRERGHLKACVHLHTGTRQPHDRHIEASQHTEAAAESTKLGSKCQSVCRGSLQSCSTVIIASLPVASKAADML